MSDTEFNSAPSFSVEYGDLAYDDARSIRGVWYYRDPVTQEILRFPFQHRVVVLRKNLKQFYAIV